jgi:hypothetical protein
MSNGDNEKVFANMKKFNESREKHLKAELLKQTPAPPAGGSGDSDSNPDNMSMEQWNELEKTNPVLFKQMLSQKEQPQKTQKTNS